MLTTKEDYPAKPFVHFMYYQSVFSERKESIMYNLFLHYPYYNIYESQINNYLSFTESVCNFFVFHPSLIYPFFSIVKSNDVLTDIYPSAIKEHFMSTFEKHREFLCFLGQFQGKCLIDQLMEFLSFRDSILKDFYEEADDYSIHVMKENYNLAFILFEFIQTKSNDIKSVFQSNFKMKRTIFNRDNVFGIKSSKYPLTNPTFVTNPPIIKHLKKGFDNISLTQGAFPPTSDLKSEIEIFFLLLTSNEFTTPFLKSRIILNGNLVEIKSINLRNKNKDSAPFIGTGPLLSEERQTHLFSILTRFGYHFELE